MGELNSIRQSPGRGQPGWFSEGYILTANVGMGVCVCMCMCVFCVLVCVAKSSVLLSP